MRILCPKTWFLAVILFWSATSPVEKKDKFATQLEHLPGVSPPTFTNDSTDCYETIILDKEYDFVPVLKCRYRHNGINTYSLPLFADIDGDGQTEVVLTLEHSPDGFAVVNPKTCEAEHVVDIEANVELKDGGTVLGDVDRNGYVDIFIVGNSKIQRWEYNPDNQQVEKIWETREGVATADRAHLDIYDLNQDGKPELIPNIGHLVDAITGYVYAEPVPLLNTEGKGLFAYTADADPGQAPDGQGNVELIHGTHLYRYDFHAEKWVLVREVPSLDWGEIANVSIADMDLDGDVDAVISHWNETGEALIWDLQTTELLGGGVFDYPGSFGSRINIANMDKDPYPEMVMTCVRKIFAIEDIVTTAGFGSILWLDETSDKSGHTQITSFDFDGNGTYEIAYRDETRLRIFSGMGTGEPNGEYPSTPRVLLNSGDAHSCESFTGMEYPTIGDIDNDNEAEILATCRTSLNIYESGSLPWGDASKVWNTQAFNVINVNQDGTIPSRPIENYTIYNNFLAQVNTNPPSDTIKIALGDAFIQDAKINDNCDGTVSFELEICNQGEGEMPENTPIAVYRKNPTSSVAELLEVLHISESIGISQCITLATQYFEMPEGPVEVAAIANDDGQHPSPFDLVQSENEDNFPSTAINECTYINNIARRTFVTGQTANESKNVSICEGESYNYQGRTYSEAGSYDFTYSTALGCDSIFTLNVNILNTIEYQTNAVICQGEALEFHGRNLEQPGIYTETLSGINGCDSLVIMELAVLEPVQTNLDISLCEGTEYTLGNHNYREAGNYQESFTATNGCDSIVTLQLSYLPHTSAVIAHDLCQGEVFQFQNRDYQEAGQYIHILQSSNGCDSVITLELSVLNPVFEEFNTTVCEGETYQLGSRTLGETGTYEEVFQAVNSCDSIVRVHLEVMPEILVQNEAEICPGESYQLGNRTLNEAGQYLEYFQAANGCDSIVDLRLNVLDNPFFSFRTEICEGTFFQYHDSRYSDPGHYVQTLSNSHGCDSIIEFYLDVMPLAETFLSEEICEGEQFTIGLENFFRSGDYQAVLRGSNGCDSIVHLKLDVHPQAETNLYSRICEGAEYQMAGRVLTQSGYYTEILSTSEGCDSTVNLNLDVVPQIHSTNYHRICEGDSLLIAGTYRYRAGVFQEALFSSAGCDSVVEHHLEVLPKIEIWGANASICKGESVQLEAFGADVYRWEPAYGLSCTDCPNPVANPEKSVSYTVTSNGCMGNPIQTTVEVEVFELPNIETADYITIAPGQSVELTAKSVGPEVEINWETEDGKTLCEDCPTVKVQPEKPSLYIAYAFTKWGCFAVDTVLVDFRLDCIASDFFIPNMISPNGDGVNDQFYIESQIGAELRWLRIYDRWGEMIFNTSDFNEKWDGTFRGQALTPGVYVYYMEVSCPDNRPFRKMGNVTVLY